MSTFESASHERTLMSIEESTDSVLRVRAVLTMLHSSQPRDDILAYAGVEEHKLDTKTLAVIERDIAEWLQKKAENPPTAKAILPCGPFGPIPQEECEALLQLGLRPKSVWNQIYLLLSLRHHPHTIDLREALWRREKQKINDGITKELRQYFGKELARLFRGLVDRSGGIRQ